MKAAKEKKLYAIIKSNLLLITCKSFGVFNKYRDNLKVAALICGHDGYTRFLLKLKREEKQVYDKSSIHRAEEEKKIRYIKT